MSATGVQMNWTSVSYASTSITRVTSITFDAGGEIEEFEGDNNIYPVVIARKIFRPSCNIVSGDAASLFGLGGPGTILATQPDAFGATGGAINWSMLNAVHVNTTDSGSWGTMATATATFRAYSSDGTTPPLTIASRT